MTAGSAKRLGEAARLIVGDPLDLGTDVAIVIGEEDTQEFERWMRDTPAAGARLL
jgi:hypothetical protein